MTTYKELKTTMHFTAYVQKSGKEGILICKR